MKFDLTPLYHAIIAIVVQSIIGLLFNDWFTGGALACVWWIAREHTQAEYRWISKFGAGKRDNMPWWGGFDPKAWDLASVADFTIPIITAVIVYLILK